jgi:hypothetical protein
MFDAIQADRIQLVLDMEDREDMDNNKEEMKGKEVEDMENMNIYTRSY